MVKNIAETGPWRVELAKSDAEKLVDNFRWRHLFNTDEHWLTQISGNFYSFYLYHDEMPVAALRFSIEGKTLVSPVKAPYGGMEIAENRHEDALQFFLKSIIYWARGQGLSEISIRVAPECYDVPTQLTAKRAFLRAGFRQETVLDTSYLEVDVNSFQSKLAPQEKRRLRKATEAGMSAAIVESPEAEEIYAFIAGSREKQGYHFSLVATSLEILLKQFPNEMLVVRATVEKETAAMSLCIRPAENVLYHFAPADNPKFRRLSPTVFITEFLYRWCYSCGIAILDLGTSADHLGVLKPGLLRFKQNLGAKLSPKITFSLRI